MRRINIFAVVILMLGALIFVLSAPFARKVASFSAPMPQTPGGTTTLRRIQVNARTIAALPRTQNYVVDLTQRSVKYEFDAQAGKIDLTRVRVRTAQGEVAIGSFLEKMVPKDKLVELNLASQSFILGTRATGAVQPPPRTTSLPLLSCGSIFCTCKGRDSCVDMIFGGPLCGEIVCWKDKKDGDDFCVCNRTA